MKTHPHADASYRVVPLTGDSFGVEVAIPGTNPTTVSSFATEAEAAAWITQTKNRIESEATTQRWFQRSRRYSR